MTSTNSMSLQMLLVLLSFRNMVITSAEDSRGGYSGEGYNLYNGPWIQSAQEHAKERAEEMEGEWKGCLNQADLVIILDSSTSVGQANFVLMLEFSKNILFYTNIDSGAVRVGFLSYSTVTTVEFHLNFYNSKREIFRAIDNIPWRYGSTNTADALLVMHSEMFTPENGDRLGIPNIAIIITDGISNINSRRTIPEADAARVKCIKIVTIGIGLTDIREVMGISSDPANVFFVQLFEHLVGIEEYIIEAICASSSTISFVQGPQRVKSNSSSGTCKQDEFMCFNGECTSMDNFCDNKVDCKDGTDEDTCSNWMNSEMECLHRHDIYGRNFKGKMRPITVDGKKCTGPCEGREGYGIQCVVNGLYQYCHVPFCNTESSDNRMECNFETSFCGWKVFSNATVNSSISDDEKAAINISAVDTSKTILSSPFIIQSQSARLKFELSIKRTKNSYWKTEKSGYYQSEETLTVIGWQNEDCSQCTIQTSIYDKLNLIFLTHGVGPHEVQIELSTISLAAALDDICRWDEILCDGMCKSLAIVNDGLSDCSFSSLASDEHESPTCYQNELLCKSGKCIPESFPSSLKKQCLSNQTEFPFKKATNKCPSDYICKQKDVFSEPICLRNDQVCDRIPHCPHWDDEAKCPLRLCPHECYSCEDNMYVCEPRALQDIPIQAYGIDLSGHNLNITEFCSRQWSSLSYLNVSQCGITGIPCIRKFPLLRKLDASYNEITHGILPQHDRAIFILDGNPLIQVTYNSTYRLSLRHAGIKKIAWRESKYTIEKTIHINLQEDVDFVKPLAFCGIRGFNLGYNKIETIDFLTTCWNLLYLDLQNNAISNLTEDSLQRLKRIVELNLASNLISLIPNSAFSRLNDLRNLNLRNNRISRIKNNAFVKNDKLRKIDLGQNKLTNIPATFFSNLEQLEVLYLDNNEIQDIDRDAFNDLTALKVLDLSNNNIRSILEGLFRYMVSLKALYLHRNNIATYEKIFSGIRVLSKLTVDKFSLCCARPKSVSIDKCVSPQITISSCKYLMKTEFLSPFVCLVTSVILVGTAIVFTHRYRERSTISNINKTFLIHISIVDFVVGLCTFTIATQDVLSKGVYGFVHDDWRESFMCETLRLLFLLCTITSTLFSAITSLLKSTKQLTSKRKIKFYGTTIWLCSISITLVFFFVDKFVIKAHSAKHHVCLMIPLHNDITTNDIWNMMFTSFHTICIGITWLGELWRLKKNKESWKSALSCNIVHLIIFGISLRNTFVCIKGFMTMMDMSELETLDLLAILIYPMNSAVNTLLQLFGKVPTDDVCIIKEIIPRKIPYGKHTCTGKSERVIIVTNFNTKLKGLKARKKQNIQVKFSDTTDWKYSCKNVRVVRHVILCDAPPFESIDNRSEMKVNVAGLPLEHEGESSAWYEWDATQLTQ